MKAPTINVFRLGFTVGWLSFMTNQDAGWACSLTPSALATLRMVAKLGLR